MGSTDEPQGPKVFSRRDALKLGGLGVMAAGALTLVGCSTPDTTGGSAGGASSTTAATTPPAPSSGGLLLPTPIELRSTDGVLDVAFVAAPAMVPWQDGTRYALTYNGISPGPTLRARPGDVINVTLRNELDEPTNLHTHGLHVSPEGTSDNVFIMIEPGQEFSYRYEIPSDHPSGTFWYHPHHHGNTAQQLFGGMAGAIIIDDEIDDSGAMVNSSERMLILADPNIGDSPAVLDATMPERMQGRQGDAVLVNGVQSPTIAATTGTTERWRIVNTSPSRFYNLTVDGLTMVLVGTDQGRLRQPEPVDQIVLTPGQRAEVMVALTDPGTFTLVTTEVDRGSMSGGTLVPPAGTVTALLSVEVTGTSGAQAPPPPSQLDGPDERVDLSVDSTRSMSLGGSGMGMRSLVIDGQSFDMDVVNITTTLGTTERWTITNPSMMDHPFHIHVWPFKVVERSDGAPLDPGWRDTVNVPAGGSVSILMPFEDISGRTVYHCHILDHEDIGMMGVIEVV